MNLPEVTNARASLSSGSSTVSFTAPLTDSIKQALNTSFNVDISASVIPMRWIIGDTARHADSGRTVFKNTYLVYLNDSPGEFIIDTASYPMTANMGYTFSEGLIHQAQNTGTEARLVLGPMNEFAEPVGPPKTIQYYSNYTSALEKGNDYIASQVTNWIINDQTEGVLTKINEAAYNNITSWRIAIADDGTGDPSAWPGQVYTNSDDLSTIGEYKFYLYPHVTIQYYSNYTSAQAKGTDYIAIQATSWLINDAAPGVLTKIDAGSYDSITTWRIAAQDGISLPTTPYTGTFGDQFDLNILDPYTYYLYPSVVTIKYYRNYYDAFNKNGNPIGDQAGTWIVKDPNTVNPDDGSGFFTNTTRWRIALVNNANGTIPFDPPFISPQFGVYQNPFDLSTFEGDIYYLYPDANTIEYYANLNNADDGVNVLATQVATYVIKDQDLDNIITIDNNAFNSYNSWKIAFINNDSNPNDPIPSDVYQNPFDLSTLERGTEAKFLLYRYLPPAGSITIQYYSHYGDAVLKNNKFIATQGTSWIINDQSVIDIVNPIYNTYYSWRIALIDQGPAPPHGVYRNGFNLADFNIGNYAFYLYPTITCFLEGTKILCLVDGVEKELPIETLKPGVLVKTNCDGFKEIAMIGKGPIQNPAGNERIENRLYKCSRAKYPSLNEDLYITGCHSILEHNLTDNQRIDSMRHTGDIFVTSRMYRLMAFMDDRAEPWDSEGTHTIWHVALENTNASMNYGIYANGLLVESCAINFLKNRSSMTLV